MVQTTPREEDAPPIDMEEAITIQSSSENELDNLPTFDIDRVVSKLQSISTDDSADDAIETLISGRRSSTKSGNIDYLFSLTSAEPDEMSSSPTPKSSFVLIPLRRNPQGPKDIPASPRRPKTAIDDEEFLAKFRQDTWDIVTDEPSNNTTTARGKSHESNDSSHVRIRQSTGNLSARLHPIQRRQENGDKDHPISASSSPHTSRSSSHRKTLHPPSSSWTEQLEESKEALDTCCVESGKLFTKGSESAKAPLLSANDIPAQSHPRSKHSQLHLAGTSSLKSHTTSLTVNSQPSTPTQTRRKMPTTSSTNGLQPQRPTFVSSNSDRSLSPSLGISGHGAAGGSEIPSFLSSGNPRQISSRAGTSSSSRMSKIIDSNSPTISPNKVTHR